MLVHRNFLKIMTMICVSFIPSTGYGEDFFHDIIPSTTDGRYGNSVKAITTSGEEFDGAAWLHEDKGYFCFSSQNTTCGGTYDALSNASSLHFSFECLDGRRGNGVSERTTTASILEPFSATGTVENGSDFVALFGPVQLFSDGISCLGN